MSAQLKSDSERPLRVLLVHRLGSDRTAHELAEFLDSLGLRIVLRSHESVLIDDTPIAADAVGFLLDRGERWWLEVLRLPDFERRFGQVRQRVWVRVEAGAEADESAMREADPQGHWFDMTQLPPREMWEPLAREVLPKIRAEFFPPEPDASPTEDADVQRPRRTDPDHVEGQLTPAEMGPEEAEATMAGWVGEAVEKFESLKSLAVQIKAGVEEHQVDQATLAEAVGDLQKGLRWFRRKFDAPDLAPPEITKMIAELQADARILEAAQSDPTLPSSSSSSVSTAGSPSTPPAVWRRTFATFQSDVPPPEIPGRETPVPDALQLGDFARHLAEMMGARETPLPLSLGLFGDWGTGKTHFMRLLREKMRSLPPGPDTPWCDRIVPVQFNAWHYLDANLWASLVTEIFDSLFQRVHADQKTAQEAKEALLKKLEEANGAAAKAKEEARQAVIAEKNAAQALADAQTAQETEAKGLAAALDDAAVLLEVVKKMPEGKALVGKWEELCVQMGWGRLEQSAQALNGQLAEIRSLGGRVQVLWNSAFGREKSWPMLALLAASMIAVPLLCVAVTDWFPGGRDQLQRNVAVVTGWFTAVGGWLGVWTRRAQKQVGAAEQLQRQLAAARRRREETPAIVEKRKALADAEVKRQAAEKELAAAQAKVRALREEAREQEPERRLLRFIDERARAQDYRQHLGLVSLVRRDFQTLSGLFAETREAGWLKEKRSGSLEASIDRIVLYVDDLDRCPAERVVQVLEAVHLLLAFPLFVVVVAVDPRWLQRSLRQHYPELLDELPARHAETAVPAEGPAVRDARGRSATPMDYLEKIFHVPFHLPRMEDAGFKQLVAELTRTEEPKTAKKQSTPDDQAGPGVSSLSSSSQSSHARRKAAGALPSVESGRSSSRSTAAVGSESSPIGVRLGAEEIAALQEYALFIRTPRAVKRLLNTYRLVSAGLGETHFKNLPSDRERALLCRPAMLLLAVAAGFPSLAREWFATVRATNDWKSPGADPALEAPEFAELRRAIELRQAGGWSPGKNVNWADWIDRVGRFAF